MRSEADKMVIAASMIMTSTAASAKIMSMNWANAIAVIEAKPAPYSPQQFHEIATDIYRDAVRLTEEKT